MLLGSRILTPDQLEMIEEINEINEILYSNQDFEGACYDYMDGMTPKRAKLISEYMNKNYENDVENIWFKLKDSENKFLKLQGFYIKSNYIPDVAILELKNNKENKNFKEFQLVEIGEEPFTFDKFEKLSKKDIEILKELHVEGKLSDIEDEEFFSKLIAA